MKRHLSLATGHSPFTLRHYFILSPFTFILLWLSACAPADPPAQLYLLDVSDLALNHTEYCIGLTGSADGCDETSPPPAGKTHADLLRDYDTLIFLTSLQGIVNRDAPRLYLLGDHRRGGAPGVDEFWLNVYREPERPYGWLADTKIIELESWTDALDLFAADLNGSVVWDPAVPATLNVATTIAGVENLAVLRDGSDIAAEVTARLPVRQSLAGLFRPDAATLPGSDTPSSGSPKTDAYLWAAENYLDTGQANAQFLAYLLDGWPAHQYAAGRMTRGGVYALERDYVIQQRGFAFDLSPWPNERPNDDPHQPRGADAAAFQRILDSAQAQAAGGLIKIWGFIPWYQKYSTHVGGEHLPTAGEWESTWRFSQAGGYLQGGGGDAFGVAMANVSFHKFGPPPAHRAAPAPPTEDDLIAAGYLLPTGQVNPERTFVMFYAGDYDLAHPVLALLGSYATAGWPDAHRGDVPLAWGFNPALTEDIPAVMNYLYATATPQDYFVAANSGAGYLNPDALSQTALLRWLWRSGWAYRNYGYNIQGFLLNGNGAQISQRRLDAFTLIAPLGILSLENQTDEPWPRLQRGTPVSAIPAESPAGTPDLAADSIHTVYRRAVLEEGRPPFLAIRAAFQSPTFLWGTANQLAKFEAEGRFTDLAGRPVHPGYTVVDPYTFFELLRRQLNEQLPITNEQ
ncbi:MAG: hypothetical protein D6768_20955 [Chloroflexi bacterium]|nr:MAG: hypothetical protein D6768_20955 [Chloroflexota bacterium]